ncbi:MAG: hypothetical protein IJU00_11370 [Selenomonas sp.]|nr:hypothetical protein [Selenomonas sp.]
MVDARGRQSVIGPVVNSLPKNAKYVDKRQTQVSLGAAYAGTFTAGLYSTGLKTVDASKTTNSLTLYGNANANVIKAGTAASKLYGQNGHDTLLGGKMNDTLYGGNGNDSLSGGNGRDYLSGGNGNDILLGGSGNDTLWGGKSNDTIYGGSGNDIYLYYQGDGKDVLMDYASNEAIKVMSGQVIDVYANKKHRNGANWVRDVQLIVGDGSITLENVSCDAKLNIYEAGSKTTMNDSVKSLKTKNF